jgi:DNA-binding transcriptional LysR family regulator
VWTDVKITPYLGEFLQRYPDIQVELQCTDAIQDVIAERLDLVIRIGSLTDSSYVAVPLGDIRPVLCATPAYLESYPTPETPGDLLEHNCVIYEHYSRWCFSKHDDTQLVDVSGNIHTNMATVLLSSIQQNIGPGLLPDLLIEDQLASGELVELLPSYEVKIHNLDIDKIFAMYTSRHHLPAKVRVFIEFLKEKFSVTDRSLNIAEHS